MKNTVSVPASFFVKTAKRDYGSPAEAFLREFLQNSRDAGSTKIDIVVESIGGKVVFFCKDNGSGMTEETIRNKLMALGETTKSEGQTGGFGVAKILIYFAHLNYEIETNNIIVSGSGSGYSINKSNNIVHGVRARVDLNPEVIPDDVNRLVYVFRNEIGRSCLDIDITVNGSLVTAGKRKGRLANDFGNGVKAYKRKLEYGTASNYMVRVKGLHMFSCYCSDLKHEVIVELDGYSTDLLTTNRDGFRGTWRDTVSAYVQSLATNSSVGNKSSTTLYRGASSRVSAKEIDEVVKAIEAANELILSGNSSDAVADVAASLSTQSAEAQVVALEAVHKAIESGSPIDIVNLRNQMKHHYYVETNGSYRKVPKKWEPANFTSKQKGLLELWAAIVALALEDAGMSNVEFDVGFTLDDETSGETVALAKYMKTVNGNVAFLLNPEVYGSDKRLPPLKSQDMVHYLMSLATHEVTHAAGYGNHNESFIVAEAEIRRKAMKRLKKYMELRKS